MLFRNILNSDYYPFGSEMPGRSLYSGDVYKHGYQGDFTEKDEEVNWDAFELRNWDGRLARWTTIDPYGQYWSPYLGMGNNPINGVDPDGGWVDEWKINVETGDKTWFSSLGGDKYQFLTFVDNENRIVGTRIINGPEFYYGLTSNGWEASNLPLWDGIPSNYNLRSGYNYNMDDLEMRYWVLNSEQSSHLFAITIKQWENEGMAEPLTGKNYWAKYGHTEGTMKVGQSYLKTALEMGGIHGTLSGGQSYSGFRNGKGFSTSNIAKGIKSSNQPNFMNRWIIENFKITNGLIE